MSYFIDGFRKYAVFTGIASLHEFWLFWLYYVILRISLMVICGVYNLDPMIVRVYGVFCGIPLAAVCTRRIRDAGYNPWLALVPIYNLYLAALATNSGKKVNFQN